MNHNKENFKGHASIFVLRFRELMRENKHTYLFLQDFLKISRQSISQIAIGARYPTCEFVRRVSKFYNVSADYLLGLSDCKGGNLKVKKVCDSTGLNIEDIKKLSELKKSNPEVLKILSQLITSTDEYNRNILDLIFNFYNSENCHIEDVKNDILTPDVKESIFLLPIINYLKKIKEEHWNEVNRIETELDEIINRRSK